MENSSRKTLNSTIILIIFGLIVAAKGASRVQRIIGGAVAAKCEFPFEVRLLLMTGDNVDYCGGAIITKRHILTAAHCLYNVERVVAHCGLNDVNDPELKKMKFEKTFIHPNFTSSTQTTALINRNDIAIGFLKKNAKLSPSVSIIPLTSVKLDKQQIATLAGWGKVSKTQSSGTLHKMFVKIKDLSGLGLDPNEFGGVNTTADFCPGDSGSPLITSGSNPVVIGVAIRSQCVIGAPHIYTNVYEYLPWIHTKIPSSYF